MSRPNILPRTAAKFLRLLYFKGRTFTIFLCTNCLSRPAECARKTPVGKSVLRHNFEACSPLQEQDQILLCARYFCLHPVSVLLDFTRRPHCVRAASSMDKYWITMPRGIKIMQSFDVTMPAVDSASQHRRSCNVQDLDYYVSSSAAAKRVLISINEVSRA